MSDKPPVVIAMSGGVDSSVAAGLLVEQGYPVTGIMLRLWSEPGSESENRCCTPDDVIQARRVAARLGIPFYVMDVRDIFRQRVVQYFLDGYVSSRTPNPCVACNRLVRWGVLLDQVRAAGAEYLATGHYARVRKGLHGKVELLRGLDLRKDQSYVLSMLDQQQISHTLFPLGERSKGEVRQIARRFGLIVAEKSESQDLCFLGQQDYRDFLIHHAPDAVRPGPILDRQGNVLGTHQGLAFYTIGQRKGIGISASEPLYVLAKEPERNVLLVGTSAELGQDRILVSDFNWIAGEPPGQSFNALVKIRYQADLVQATIKILENKDVQVCAERRLRDITPGQIAALYHNDSVLGGGIIRRGGGN